MVTKTKEHGFLLRGGEERVLKMRKHPGTPGGLVVF